MEDMPPFLQSLSEYPRWFVVACLTVVAAGILWLLAKVLKWTIYLLLAVILLGGGATAFWLLWRH